MSREGALAVVRAILAIGGWVIIWQSPISGPAYVAAWALLSISGFMSTRAAIRYTLRRVEERLSQLDNEMRDR